VIFEVRDTGVGIAPADQGHIFEAFRQVAAGPSRPLEGTGLGLTIAREIAHALGGDITCQSTVGVGSLFRFTARLPSAAPPQTVAAPLAIAQASTVADSLAAQAGEPPGQRQPHVLLVEDNDLNALVASAFLERCGLEVEHVHDGREAVRHALREVGRPDLILMDCLMPTLDGFEATREIRNQEQALGLARVPVIALTATASEEDRRRCISAGMDDFLAKPFTDADLMALMSVWLQPPGGNRGAPPAPVRDEGGDPSLGGKGFLPTEGHRRFEQPDVGVHGAHHEGVERMVLRMPFAFSSAHVEGQDPVIDVPGMRQRHGAVVVVQAGEAQTPVLPDQGRTAGADDHPAHLVGQAIEVAGLHQRELDERVGLTRNHRQPGDLGPRVVAHGLGHLHAAFDQQGAMAVDLDPRRAHRLAAGFVGAHQHGRGGGVVQGVGLRKGGA
jgi:CheY-like chemotaxis protein